MENKTEEKVNEAISKDPEEETFDIGQLKEMLKCKNEAIQKFTMIIEKLRGDFNYNVELIYERDQEIEMLNRRVDDLIILNQEKDVQIKSLLAYCSRVKQLEMDKQILSNRLEAIISSRKPNKNQFMKTFTPSPYKLHSTQPNWQSPLSNLEVNQKYRQSKEKLNENLSSLNSELENRIKALQNESFLNKSIDKPSNDISLDDIDKMKEKVHLKEVEISNLINSINPYKYRSKKKHLTAEDSFLNDLNQDIEQVKNDLKDPKRG